MPHVHEPKISEHLVAPAKEKELIGYRTQYTSHQLEKAIVEIRAFYADGEGNPPNRDSILNNPHRVEIVRRALVEQINLERLDQLPDKRRREVIAALAARLEPN